jgi:diaminopimelate epimerase
MGRIDDEGAFAAALTFLDLEKTGRVRRVNFGNGHIQFSITEAGRAHLTGVAP